MSKIYRPYPNKSIDKLVKMSEIDKLVQMSLIDKPVQRSQTDKLVYMNLILKPVKVSPITNWLKWAKNDKQVLISQMDKKIKIYPMDKPVQKDKLANRQNEWTWQTWPLVSPIIKLVLFSQVKARQFFFVSYINLSVHDYTFETILFS